MTHRRPPLPASMKAPGVAGTCRWCALPIVRPDGRPDRRRTWHPACVTTYRIAAFSQDQRKAVARRDKGICAHCHLDTMANRLQPNSCHKPAGTLWQADHIKPLRDANGDFSFYTLANLQTLCRACHQAKTTLDNRRRKALRSSHADTPISPRLASPPR